MNAFASLAQDSRYALRSILRAPLLASICIVTLALGISLNATVHTILTGLLFRARVDKEADRFVHLSPSYRESTAFQGKAWSISTRDYLVYDREARTLEQLAAWDNVRVTVGDGDSVLGLLVTCNFFSVYGLDRPTLGRLFTKDECSYPGPAQVVILSEEIWRERFNADPHIAGKTVRLNRRPFTVAGIVPAGFSGRVRGPGIWVPWSLQPLFYQGHDFFREDARWLTVEGRLNPGFSRDDARAELQVLAGQQDRLRPGRQTTMSLTNGALAQELSVQNQVFWISPVIMGGLTLVLLVTCTNVAVLQLSRAVSRRREMAIRLSLGAGTGRLIRMLLTESLVLALLAGLAGSLVVHRAPEVFARVLASPDTPVYQTRPDASTLLYFSAIVFVAACLSGLSPAAEALRVDLVTSIKKGGSDPSRSRTHRSRSLLVAAQVGMTFVLLATAGWFIRARATVLHGDPGFETEHVLLLPINLRPADIATLSRRIREIPGIRNVAFGSPIGQSDLGSNSEEIRLPGQEKGAGRPALLSLVSARYFEVLGMPVLLGRAFTEADEHHTSALCIVSEQFAKAFWPGADPIGRRVLLADGAALEVAGVVRDVASERLGQNDGPHIYRLAGEATQSTPMLIRFSGDERQIGLAVRKALTETDPAAVVPLHSLRFLMNQAADRLARLIWLVCGLAGLAVLLAALGLYGVVDFTMHQRSKELGIRMALGASRTEILKTALLGGAKPVLLGLVAGSTAAMGAGVVVSRVLRHTPVALNPYDFAVYLATAIVLATTALLAMFRPVWRAAVSDPLPALRNE